MEYRKLGSTGLKVSEICFGTATFGWHTDQAEAGRMLNLFAEAGGNFIDTADTYAGWAEGSSEGSSEQMIGQWLRESGKRHEIVLATKCGSKMGPLPNDTGLSRRHIMAAAEASLKRLGTDFIDLYQTHFPDEDTPVDETMRALDDLVRGGKVRYLGCSNYSAWQLGKALWASDKYRLARFDCTQPYYNLIDREGFERELAGAVREEGLAVIPYSPLAMGFLTGKYRGKDKVSDNTRGSGSDRMAGYFTERNFKLLDEAEAIGREYGKSITQVALAWLLSDPLITAPIVGARDCTQLKESIGAAGFRLAPEQKERLDKPTAWRK